MILTEESAAEISFDVNTLVVAKHIVILHSEVHKIVDGYITRNSSQNKHDIFNFICKDLPPFDQDDLEKLLHDVDDVFTEKVKLINITVDDCNDDGDGDHNMPPVAESEDEIDFFM